MQTGISSARARLHEQKANYDRPVWAERRDEFAGIRLPSREELHRAGHLLGFTEPSRPMPKEASFDRKIQNVFDAVYQRLLNAQFILMTAGAGLGIFAAGTGLLRADLELIKCGGMLTGITAVGGAVSVLMARYLRSRREREITAAASEKTARSKLGEI